MSSARKRSRLFLIITGALLAGLAPALSQLDFNFMPKGGKTLLIELFASPADSAELQKVIAARRTEQEWRVALSARKKTLSEKEQRTLAVYLAVNMPLPESALEQARKPGNLEAVLPRDGRDLAWNECQFCHSLFSSHLTQDRDVRAWLNMFQSPFHRELKMTAKEREEFSHYSAINMPMKIDDVPRDLRF